MKKRSADILVFIALTALGAMLIARQREVSAAVTDAVESCVYRIIPSLFAMTVISSAVAKSGILNTIFSRSRISADILAAFIFGNIGGYPIGAKLLSEAVTERRIMRTDAEKAMPFCFGAGPAFAAGVVGAVFGDIRIGLAALFANIAANLTLYAVFLICEGKATTISKSPSCGFSTRLMTDSVSSAASAMIGISSMIVFFSAIKAVIESLFPSLLKLKYFAAILEISNISALSVRDGVSLTAAALLLGFGGICVNLQIIAIINGSFSLKRFYLSRLISAPLTAFYSYLITIILPHLGIAAETSTKIRLNRSPSLIPMICVIAMVLITLRESPRISR